MVNRLISGHAALMNVNRQVSKLTAATIAPGEDPPAGIAGSTKVISTQPAQLSTLGGFKNALAEFRKAAAALTALAKVLALKPLLTDSLPKAFNSDAIATRTVDSTSLKPVNRPVLPLGDSSLPDTDLPQAGSTTVASAGDPTAFKPTAAQSGGDNALAGHVVARADLDKQAWRLLDTLKMATARLPGLQAGGLISGQESELRLDAGRLEAAMVARPRTIASLFNTIELNPDEAQLSPPSPSLRSSGAATTALPLAMLSAALTDFREKTRIVTGLARLLANPTPVVEHSLGPLGQAVSAAVPEPDIETLYLNHEETLLSTALLRTGDRLAPLTLQFQAGRYDVVTQRFLADPQQSPVHLALSDGNDTLPGLCDAIQASNPNLGVAVVKGNAGYRLAMRLPGETMAHSIAVSISKAANPPVVAGEGQLLGFTVQRDADAVCNAVQSLVGAYSRLNTAANALSSDLQAPAGPLRQSLAGALANPERGRTLAQIGVIVQRDGSLLIDPIRLATAIAAHPKQVLDLFADYEGGTDDESGTTEASADFFTDWLSELGDSKEPWDAQRGDQSPEATLDPDGGQGSDGRQNAVEMHYRTRLETVNRLMQRLFSTQLWLRPELERLSDRSASADG